MQSGTSWGSGWQPTKLSGRLVESLRVGFARQESQKSFLMLWPIGFQRVKRPVALYPFIENGYALEAARRYYIVASCNGSKEVMDILPLLVVLWLAGWIPAATQHQSAPS